MGTACSADDGWQVADGVATRQVTVKARGTDLVDVDLFAPAQSVATTGQLAHQLLPGLVLCPGGLVDPDQYAWLARRLALRGFAVAIPHFPNNLGFFAQDNAQVALRLLVKGSTVESVAPLAAATRVAVAGHSLGAVVAAAVATDGGFAALALLAGYPADGDAVEGLQLPAIAVAGTADCSAPVATVHSGWKRLPKGAWLATVTGLSHYGFTDSLTPDNQSGCPPQLTLVEGHDRIGAVLEQFLLRSLVDPSLPLPTSISSVAWEVQP